MSNIIQIEKKAALYTVFRLPCSPGAAGMFGACRWFRCGSLGEGDRLGPRCSRQGLPKDGVEGSLSRPEKKTGISISDTLKYIIHFLYFTIFVYDSCKFDFPLNIMVEHSTKAHKVIARLYFCWLYGTANSGMPEQTWTEDCLYKNSPPSLQRRNLLRLGQLLPSWWVNTTQTYLTLEIFETNSLFI